MKATTSKYFFYLPATILKGEHVFKYMNAYRRFQYFSRDAIESYQLHHFQKLVKHAAEKSSYYKNLLKDAGFDPKDVNTLEQIKLLPTLTKENLVTHRRDIETAIINPFVSKKTTGGSTGQAVTLLKNPDALARAATARSL